MANTGLQVSLNFFVGGAIISINNTLVTITQSFFHDNHVISLSDVSISENCLHNYGPGGSLYLDQSTVEIDGTLFINNTACIGGAVYATNSRVLFTNSTFQNNKASLGGVIGVELAHITLRALRLNSTQSTFYSDEANNHGIITSSFIVVDNCTFNSNTATYEGGVVIAEDTVISVYDSYFGFNNGQLYEGVLFALNCTVTVDSLIFHGNTATSVGVLLVQDSVTKVYNCLFEFNTAVQDCGTLYAVNSYVVINSSTFHNNAAGQGIIVAINSSVIDIDNCTFNNNTAITTGGVFSIYMGVRMVISNSHFEFNKAGEYSGVLFIKSGSVAINGSAFYSNRAKSLGGVMLAAEGSTVEVYKSDFQGNTAEQSGGVMAVFNGAKISVNKCQFAYNGLAIERAVGVSIVAAANSSVVIIASSVFRFNTMKNNSFSNNTHSLHVISLLYAKYNSSLVVKSHCLFYGNAAILHTLYSSTAEINGAIIAHNTADALGIVIAEYSCTLKINNTIFKRNFVRASKNISSCVGVHKSNMTIHNCSFQYNEILTNTQSLASIVVNSDSIANVSSSVFFKNTGSAINVFWSDNSTFDIRNTLIESNVANYGGALSCFGQLREKLSVITVKNVTFSLNSATFFGGAVYFYRCKLASTGDFLIHNNSLKYGSSVIYFLQSTAEFTGKTNISNNIGSVFAIESNVSFIGITNFVNGSTQEKIRNINGVEFLEAGAITLFNSNLFMLGKTTLVHNQAYGVGGAIIAINSIIDASGVTIITNNFALLSGGGIYAYQSKITFMGNTTFASNLANESGGGMHAISSLTEFTNGTHCFSDNQAAKDGGALFLELYSKIYAVQFVKQTGNCSKAFKSRIPCIQNITQWLKLEFRGNSAANYGGAIYVKDNTNSDGCHRNVPGPTNECFFQALQEYYSLDHASNTPTKFFFFENNTALIKGSNLYGGLLDRCTLNPFVEHFGTESKSRITYFNFTAVQYIQSITNITTESISSLPLRVCFCDQDRKPNCSYHPPPFKVVKGQSFTVSVVAVDQVNHTLDAIIHCSVSSQTAGFAEGQARQNVYKTCTDVKYTILSPSWTEELTCHAEGPCNGLGISKQELDVHFLPCPVGFKLKSSNSSRCDCDPYLKHRIPNLICNISTGFLIRKGQFWISSFTNSTKEKYSSTVKVQQYVIYFHCPFDYCYPPTKSVFFTLNSSSGVDRQCSLNHSGLLCGQCNSGFSLSLGSNRCKDCSNYWLFLLIPFALSGCVLVAFILTLNLTVAVGTISGIVFYANIVVVNSAVYFPFEKPNFLTVFISWLNLDFGFETCFYNGMDAYVKTWLQFVFPLFIIFLVAAIIVISDYSPRFARLFTGKNPVATLATLILLSYTKLLRAIIAALSFAKINYPSNSHKIVWLLDANVPYLQGKHIPLFITAVFIALVGLAYTFVLSFWQVLLKLQKRLIYLRWMSNSKLLAFIDAYHAPYNQQHRYWSGMLLLLRTLLYLISASNVSGDPSVNLVSIICVMLFLFMHSTLVQKPFKNMLLNLMECTHYFNLSIFTTLTLYFQYSNGNQSALAITSTLITTALFALIVVYHTYTFALKKKRERIEQILQTVFNQYCFKRNTSEHARETELQNFATAPEFDIDCDDQSQKVTVTEIEAPVPHDTCSNDDMSPMTESEEYSKLLMAGNSSFDT